MNNVVRLVQRPRQDFQCCLLCFGEGCTACYQRGYFVRPATEIWNDEIPADEPPVTTEDAS